MVDERCLRGLKRLGLDKAAEGLAKVCRDMEAETVSTTIRYVDDSDDLDVDLERPYIAELTLTIRLVG